MLSVTSASNAAIGNMIEAKTRKTGLNSLFFMSCAPMHRGDQKDAQRHETAKGGQDYTGFKHNR